MHCPYLSHEDDRCRALGSRYNPSEFELDEYCATEKHRRCPFYRNRSKTALAAALRGQGVRNDDLHERNIPFIGR